MTESLRGKFLVAGRALRDENFFKSIVLMLDHGPGGALGIVVNRPSPVKVVTALSGHFDIPDIDDLVFVGGPVESSALFIVHNGKLAENEATPVVPGLFVGASGEEFEGVVRAAAEGAGEVKFRIYSGCAGWAPGQLESELARADWHLQPADADFVFNEDPHQMWDIMLKSSYETTKILPNLHGDPGLN